jgi:hypothetical protein
MQSEIVIKRRQLKRDVEDAVGGAMRVGTTGYPMINEDEQATAADANAWVIVERRPYLWDYTTTPVSASPMDQFELQAVQRARDAIGKAGYTIISEFTNQQLVCFQLRI